MKKLFFIAVLMTAVIFTACGKKSVPNNPKLQALVEMLNAKAAENANDDYLNDYDENFTISVRGNDIVFTGELDESDGRSVKEEFAELEADREEFMKFIINMLFGNTDETTRIIYNVLHENKANLVFHFIGKQSREEVEFVIRHEMIPLRVLIDNLYYNLYEDNTAEIKAEEIFVENYTALAGALTIPSTVKYQSDTYTVTRIGEGAFRKCVGLTSVTIPNSVTSIGDWAFANCESLSAITIPNSVTSIEHGTFYGCESLSAITIPNSVTRIGDWAFGYCKSLTSVTIPNSVTSIGEGAFDKCESLSAITIPNSVTSIGRVAFYECESLTSVTIPNSVTSIGDHAFYDCESLTSVTISRSTRIGGDAFSGCYNLQITYE